MRFSFFTKIRPFADRLRSQVRLFAFRLQYESDGDAGGDRLCAIGKITGIYRVAKTELAEVSRRLFETRPFFFLPEPAPNSEPSWFGFLLTVKEDAPFNRNDIVRYLEEKNIQTRMLFAGNILKHPCFDGIRDSDAYRVVGDLTNTDQVMNASFWFGVYPGLNDAKIEYVIENVKDFCAKY